MEIYREELRIDIENMLRHARALLFIRRGKPVRPHQLEERSCPRCSTISSWIIKRCKNRFCKGCRAREYRTLSIKQQNLEIAPSHFIHLIFPMPPIPIQDIRPKDIKILKDAVNKVRHQKWFKKVVLGGFYSVEMDVNEKLEVRAHVHMVVETVESSRRNPINIKKANKSWRKLTGHSIQGPFPLTRFTRENVNRLFVYVTKQLRGEQNIKGVKELIEYITRQSEELAGDTGVQDEYETGKLKRKLQRAEKLRAYIIHVLNYVLGKQRRYAFFGTWRKVELIEQVKRARRCPCGSYTPSVSHTAA